MTIPRVNFAEPARKSSVARCGNITKSRNGFHLRFHYLLATAAGVRKLTLLSTAVCLMSDIYLGL